MISTSTFAFALALAVVVNGVLAWIICEHRTRALALLISGLESSSRTLEQRLTVAESKAPSTLAAEVAALSEAVDRLRDTHRRFAGRFDAYVQHEGAAHAPKGVDDAELQAMLALQAAGPVKP